MKKDVFMTTDILLPGRGVAPEVWSVVACDQFSSEREYWERVRRRVGESPSTLNMIIPEAYLEGIDEREEIARIGAVMDDYLGRGLLREVEDSFVYVERTVSGGQVRKGLVGAVDLEEYEFSSGDAAILASEGTVLDRLPPRIRIRKAASMELPHIMTFIADKDASVIEPLAKKAGSLPVLYDFELMEGGGRLKGWRVCGSDALEAMAAMRSLHGRSKTLMIMGDGNHSLAAAKSYWDELKQGLSGAEMETHPARRALLEVNNLYDHAVTFEPIHRVIFGVDKAAFTDEFINALHFDGNTGMEYALQVTSLDAPNAQLRTADVCARAGCIGDMTDAVQTFLDGYVSRSGGRIDYIHDADAVERLVMSEGCVGIILPGMAKSEFFDTVAARGVFPRKSFSVGHARDKRYYMECRGIR